MLFIEGAPVLNSPGGHQTKGIDVSVFDRDVIAAIRRMVFRTSVAVCALASGVVADDGWVAVGSTRGANRNVTALSLAVAPDGLPRYAYGFVESEGTEIQLMAFDGKEWVEDYHHVSQYPQTYTDFRYRVAESGSNYLGLRIKCSLAEGCGSVLNSGVEY